MSGEARNRPPGEAGGPAVPGAWPGEAATDDLARTLWDYMRLGHELAPADVILVLGSNDVRVAGHGARLYLQGLAPLLMFSGGLGKLTAGTFTKSEAETFADAAVRLGVPRPSILIEPRSTNTGENVDFSRAMLAERGIRPSRIIAVQKPYMERRTWATFARRWPGPDVRVSSPPIPLDAYPTPELPRELVVNILVGDVQRMWVYAERGFQTPQTVPDEVRAAWDELVARGYTSHLVR